MSDSNLYPYPYTERGKIDDFSPFSKLKAPALANSGVSRSGQLYFKPLRYNKQV